MTKTYSIADARDHLTELVRAVETETVIHLTRRGKLVALLLSPEEYDRLQNKEANFWDAYTAFRQHLLDAAPELDPDTIFQDVRNQSTGKQAEW